MKPSSKIAIARNLFDPKSFFARYPVKRGNIRIFLDRYIGIGLLDGRVVVVVYTEPDEETVRIISLRKALSYERRRYEQYLKNRLG